MQSLQERLLMCLSCRYVDDVVIEAPYILTEELLVSLKINKVINVVSSDDLVLSEFESTDRFKVAKELGIYHEESVDQDELTVLKIAQRVADNK